MFNFVILFGTIFGVVYCDPRIVGGFDAEITAHPYQLSLQSETGRHFCGGTLISKRWALTAAHCIYGRSPEEITTLRARAGSSTFDSGGQVVEFKRAIIHPNYAPETLNNDIALVEFDSPVSIATAAPAALPAQGWTIHDGAELVVSGWGKTALESTTISTQLQEVRIPYIQRQVCKNLYEGVNVVTDNMFCAGSLAMGEKGPCSGDSGGPAFRNGRVLGIVSWGVDCTSPSFPGVFTQVSRYRNWIALTARV